MRLARRVQQVALRGVVGGLEAAHQLVEGVQNLLGEALRDLVLELAAVVEQRRQALRLRQGQQSSLLQQQAHCREDRSARGLHHVRDPEIEPARAFAARRRQQTQRPAVEQQPRRHPAAAQQSLHATVGRGLEPAPAACGAVEILARLEHPHQQLPGNAALGSIQLAHRVIRPQRLAIHRQRHLELGGNRRLRHAGVTLGRETPAQHLLGEGAEVRQPGNLPLLRPEDALLDTAAQKILPRGVAAVEDRSGAHQRRRRHHQAGRLDEADPLEVVADGGVELRHPSSQLSFRSSP